MAAKTLPKMRQRPRGPAAHYVYRVLAVACGPRSTPAHDLSTCHVAPTWMEYSYTVGAESNPRTTIDEPCMCGPRGLNASTTSNHRQRVASRCDLFYVPAKEREAPKKLNPSALCFRCPEQDVVLESTRGAIALPARSRSGGRRPGHVVDSERSIYASTLHSMSTDCRAAEKTQSAEEKKRCRKIKSIEDVGYLIIRSS